MGNKAKLEQKKKKKQAQPWNDSAFHRPTQQGSDGCRAAPPPAPRRPLAPRTLEAQGEAARGGGSHSWEADRGPADAGPGTREKLRDLGREFHGETLHGTGG